jgi:sialidase-1
VAFAGTVTGILTSAPWPGFSAGTVSLKLPQGWTAPTATMPALNPGQGADVKIPVTVPANATAGSVATTATYEVRGTQHSYGDSTLTVTAP